VPDEVDQNLRSDARDNRDRIVEVARAAFAADGLDVPIREIARRANVGVATVYRRFPTKEALLTAAFADRLAVCLRIVEEGLAATDPGAAFRAVIEQLMAVHAQDRGFARAITSQFPQVYDFTKGRDRTLTGVHDLLRRAQRAGAVRADVRLGDVILALMANEGIRAEPAELRVAASRRFAALILASFRPGPDAVALPPAVRLPLPIRG
jgi:AcrR family transcriptional regulator